MKPFAKFFYTICECCEGLVEYINFVKLCIVLTITSCSSLAAGISNDWLLFAHIVIATISKVSEVPNNVTIKECQTQSTFLMISKANGFFILPNFFYDCHTSEMYLNFVSFTLKCVWATMQCDTHIHNKSNSELVHTYKVLASFFFYIKLFTETQCSEKLLYTKV